MTDHTWLIVVMFWAIAAGLLLWAWAGWKNLDEPADELYSSDKLAQWEADIAKDEAEEESKHRPHIRAGER